MKYEIHILMGLPGSGKSYWVKNVFAKEPRDVFYDMCHSITLDSYVTSPVLKESMWSLEEVLEKAYDESDIGCRNQSYHKDYGVKTHHIVIDGLILSRTVLERVMEFTKKYIKEQVGGMNDIVFIIHHWEEDRNQCVLNDKLRVKYGERDKSSEVTIMNATFHNMNDEIFESIRNHIEGYGDTCKLVRHQVYGASEYDIAFGSYNNSQYADYEIRKTDCMYSAEWSLGGSWGNCWDDDLTYVDGDIQPEFKEFDDMLQKICPDIKFLQYKKLYSECVDVVQRSENDYYGGCMNYACYRCDLRKLYGMMVEMNLIEKS